MNTITKRHHYVWRRYLRSWAIEEQIYCYRNGKIFQTNIMNIGQEKSFYTLKNITETEIEILRNINKGMPDIVRKSHEEIFKVILEQNRLRKINYLIQKLQIENDEIKQIKIEMDNLINEIDNNSYEYYHSEIENDIQNVINLILEKKIDFKNNRDMRNRFLNYAVRQYTRTKRMKKALTHVWNAVSTTCKIEDLGLKDLLIHIFSDKVSLGVINHKPEFEIFLIENNTDEEFITTDQPIINTYMLDSTQEVSDLEFYYPVSPKLAILIAKNAIETRTLSLEKVINFNKMMVMNADSQIYGTSEKILERYKNFLN